MKTAKKQKKRGRKRLFKAKALMALQCEDDLSTWLANRATTLGVSRSGLIRVILNGYRRAAEATATGPRDSTETEDVW